MRLAKLITALDGEIVVSGDHLDDRVRHAVVSDLMSEALLAEDEDLLLFTALTTEHAVRTAHVLGALGVIVIHGETPRPGMVKTAAELGITLARTSWTRAAVLAWAAERLGLGDK